MNRKARRAAAKQGGLALAPAATSANDIYAEAMSHYRKGEFVQAENLCRLALSREPQHRRSLVLLGDLVQQGGRNKLAVKLLGQALDLDRTDTAAHDTIAIAYQALGDADKAIRHFSIAIALGLSDPELLVKQCAAVAAPLRRLTEAWPRQLPLVELLGAAGASALAGEALLLALLQSKVVHDVELEWLLTAIRRGLLQQAGAGDAPNPDSAALVFFCALAQQCFLNEYIFALGDSERAELQRVRDRVAAALEAQAPVTPLDLIVVAIYVPLHTLPMAQALLVHPWPDAIERLVTQQIREPLEEAADRPHIPALTPVDDAMSLQVQNQYEESPYPRWTAMPPINPTTVAEFLWERLGVSPWPRATVGAEILIAGCGTGSHSIDSSLRFPRARILAIDISRTSLAYARRKSRALGLSNIEYGQADILQLAALGRRFDAIEAVGVLHHLADPAAGWRQLLSLLRPNGLMLVGLYSSTARQSLTAMRDYITAHGYRATADDIRTCRQELIRRDGMPPFRDFSSLSGCRDLLFNIMEHQFTIAQIAAFLDDNRLRFLGFAQLPPDTLNRFRQQWPDAAAMRDLKAWQTFEQKNPVTFGNMYIFWVQKTEPN
jgi:2-polyprenyl-3-methyl-5-hydroxy-6-metoxy-1,4-benzoquinol methylase